MSVISASDCLPEYDNYNNNEDSFVSKNIENNNIEIIDDDV